MIYHIALFIFVGVVLHLLEVPFQPIKNFESPAQRSVRLMAEDRNKLELIRKKAGINQNKSRGDHHGDIDVTELLQGIKGFL